MRDRCNDEEARLASLRALRIVGSASEHHLDAVCRTAASLFRTPIALVTFVDESSVWIKARHGVTSVGVPREVAFCDDTIKFGAGDALVVHDLLEDERYRDSALVQGNPHARFYAGVPLSLRPGLNIGTLCVIDIVPRPEFGCKERNELFDLSSIVEAHLRLHEATLARTDDEQRYRLIADNSTDVIIWSELDSTRRYVSPAARTVLGFEPEELIGTRPSDFVHPDDAQKLRRDLAQITSGELKQGRNRHRSRCKDGSFVWLEASASLTFDPIGGGATGHVISLRDVSEQKAIEDELRLSKERLALALDGGSDGLWDWDVATGLVRLSGQWLSTLGYDDGEIESHIDMWNSIVHPDDILPARELLVAHLRGVTPRLECEYRVKTKTGGFVWTLARGKIVARDDDGQALRIVGTHIDITLRKQAEGQIAHMATHDALTGLPNRTLFKERLENEIAGAGVHGTTFAVLACDLDGFKLVNDTLGHSAGDTLLRTVAERLKAVLDEEDMIARLGGDEFAIVLSRIEGAEVAGLLATRVIEALEAPIAIDGLNTRVSVSIGIAIGCQDGRDADDLFKNADIAMYRAKAAGRATHRFYEAGMDVQVAERDALGRDIRDATGNGTLSLHYQPVISLASGTIVGFEALMRWHHPIRGRISPSEFVPIAEETGSIVALGTWALRTACEEAAKWPAHVRIAVNVSAVQFRSPGLEQSVMTALAAAGLAHDRLELEITESVFMEDAEGVLECLHRLRALGVRIALDDFGTGYSSLSYLRRFPFDKIKIDRAFVKDISNPETAAIVRAVVGLAERVGAAITAEGVETPEQCKLVEREGCTEVQGFLFGVPVASPEARVLVSDTSASAAA